MRFIDFFKNKGKDTQKELTLEDCIIKMFASADIEPHREGDEFSFKVQGKYCVFNVTLSYEANRIMVYIPFPIPVNRKVAKSSMYEVKRIDSFAQKGTIYQHSYVYTPQQNGVIENKHRPILESARAFQAHLPLYFW